MKKFTCITALCAASFSFAQIITDGSFENITDVNTEITEGDATTAVGTWFSNANEGDLAFSIETQKVSAGNKALVLSNDNAAAKLYQNLTLAPNTTYMLSLRARLVDETLDEDSGPSGGTRFVTQIQKNFNGTKAPITNAYEETGEEHNLGWKTASYQLSEKEFRTIAFEFTTDSDTAWTLVMLLQPSYDTHLIIDEVSVTEGALSKADLSKFNFGYAPNPANHVINLNAAKTISKVEFYNTLGQNVLSSKVGTFNSAINIQSLNKGVYVMNVTIEGQTQAFKILKQ